jgi:hypothetical protein
MSEITAAVERWSAFYFTTAGIAGTLLGLLFVAVSLSLEKVNSARYADLKTIASQAYGSYLLILIFSMTCLIPNATNLSLGGSLLIISATGVGATAYHIRQVGRNPVHPIKYAYIRWPVLMPVLSLINLLSFVCLVGLSLLLLLGQAGVLSILIIPLLILIVAATQTTWDFLTKRRTFEDEQANQTPD